MAPPLPNSAHGDQLISAKSRGTARFLSKSSYLTAFETDWLVGAAGFRTSIRRGFLVEKLRSRQMALEERAAPVVTMSVMKVTPGAWFYSSDRDGPLSASVSLVSSTASSFPHEAALTE